jgi:hypothetical protein
MLAPCYRRGATANVSALAFALAFLGSHVPTAVMAQSQTERGDIAWKAGTTFALQGNADSALASFRVARTIAASLHDSSLLAAALRGAAEVNAAYKACAADSSLALLRLAQQFSIVGDRAAGQVLVRRLAMAGQVAEARKVHAALYADIVDQVPRAITRESVNYLSGQAAVEHAAGRDAAALASLRRARDIANRAANGDQPDSVPKALAAGIDSQNYWVTFELAQLMLSSKTRGVASPGEGKTLMDALAATNDEPEEGNARRFSVFRLRDRLTVHAWRCELRGERCPAPKAPKCP